jgi:hypothetical protein
MGSRVDYISRDKIQAQIVGNVTIHALLFAEVPSYASIRVLGLEKTINYGVPPKSRNIGVALR